MPEHTIGLLLGTEEDWPAAFEALVGRLGTIDGNVLRTERIVNEPFDLRYKPRYSLVVDHQRACIAKRSEILRGIETECCPATRRA